MNGGPRGAGKGVSPAFPPALQSAGPGTSSGPSGDHSELVTRIASLEVENQTLRGGEALGWWGAGGPTLGLMGGCPDLGPASDQHPCTPTVVQDLQQAVSKLEARLSALEKSSPAHRATAPQTQVRAHPHQGPPAWRWGAGGSL